MTVVEFAVVFNYPPRLLERSPVKVILALSVRAPVAPTWRLLNDSELEFRACALVPEKINVEPVEMNVLNAAPGATAKSTSPPPAWGGTNGHCYARHVQARSDTPCIRAAGDGAIGGHISRQVEGSARNFYNRAHSERPASDPDAINRRCTRGEYKRRAGKVPPET